MKLLIACMTIILSMGTLWAQDDPGPRRGRRGAGFGVLVEHLGLTEQQVADLRANQQTLREASRDLIRQIGEKSRQLRHEMGQESPNAAIVGQLTVEIHDLKNQIKTLRDESRAASLLLLDESQQQRLAQLRQALSLMGAAQQAAGMNLIDGPGGPGGGSRGFGGRRGPGGDGSGTAFLGGGRGRRHGPPPGGETN